MPIQNGTTNIIVATRMPNGFKSSEEKNSPLNTN